MTDDPTRLDTLLDDRLVAAARRVIEAHGKAGTTIALAESCTGGLVTAALTEVPGASQVLLASVIPYSNEAKIALLGVGRDIIDTFGAVSEAAAWAMAQGVLNRSQADVAVAITGVAGPDGGTVKKPVGLVIFGRAHKAMGASEAEVCVETRRFTDNGRAGVRLQAALCALELLMPTGEP